MTKPKKKPSQVVLSSFSASTYDTSTTPAKPFYGMIDNRAQMVIPRSQNPPTDPILGSVYQDEDDGRIYIWSGTGIGWRASATLPIAGAGVVIDFNAETQIATVSLKTPERLNLAVTGDWTASTPAPIAWRTSAGAVNLQGAVTSGKPLAGSSIATLPVGWRPEVDFYAPCVGGSGQCNVCVYTDGRVVNINGSGQPLRLGGISFIATK